MSENRFYGDSNMNIRVILLLLLDTFLLRLDVNKEKLNRNSKCDFVIAVTDFVAKYDDYRDVMNMLHVISMTDDKDFRHLCLSYTSFVRKFFRRLDKKSY